MRKKNVIVGIGMVFTFLVIAGFFFWAQAFETQKSDANMVKAEVKPVQLAAGKPAIFEVRFDTHSVKLDDDLVSAGLLKDSQGKTYKPETWKGSPPGGHHRSGALEFPRLEGNPTSVILVLKNIGDIPERSFQWKMGN